jgi:hypothetical protein
MLGGGFGILAAILNILFVLSGQSHLIQPEVATLRYSVLQSITVIASISLGNFSLEVSQTALMHMPQ